MDLRLYRDTGSFISMNIITTPASNTAMETGDGFARVCAKCDGTGIFYRHAQTADGWSAVQDVCFPCHGTGHTGKVYGTVSEFDKARAIAEKARERREAKRQAEWEAGQNERNSKAAEVQAELATWKHLDAQVGDKVNVTGTIKVIASIETDYGFSNLIIIESDNTEAIKLFTTAGWSYEVSRDQVVTIDGTVKSFGEYEGKAQTILNRPKLVK